jgi:hypothetical protein
MTWGLSRQFDEYDLLGDKSKRIKEHEKRIEKTIRTV